jgi:3-deoxy-manno-octulosonate cytidylyltransferase (CMP-KDO synthetase)
MGATRLPGKPLLQIAGKTLIQHVWERAAASGAAEVVVATDDRRIFEVVEAFGGIACMTADTHQSGTDRITEAARLRNESPVTVIVNVQGDEPAMPAAVIRQVAEVLRLHPGVDIASVCEPFALDADWRDPNQVKVLRDVHDRALYFTRAAVPFPRETAPWRPGRDYRRHVGLYAYTVRYLNHFVTLPPNSLETTERLEQLRALAHGAHVRVEDACEACGVGIDTPADLERFAASLAAGIPR